MSEIIFTTLPGEPGVNIQKHRYNLIKRLILTILEEEGPSSCHYVNFSISDKLFALFEGEVSQYVNRVITDLEDKHIIERVPATRIKKIRIKR